MSKCKVLLYILAILHGAAYGQTRPRIAQLSNIEQIRICKAGDDRLGTLVSSCQLNDGRFVAIPIWLKAPEDAGKPTVCIFNIIRIAWVGVPGYNVGSQACYTQLGLAKLLEDPAWATWWAAHMNDPAPMTNDLSRGLAGVYWFTAPAVSLYR